MYNYHREQVKRTKHRHELWKAILNLQEQHKAGTTDLNWLEPSITGHNHQAASKARNNWRKKDRSYQNLQLPSEIGWNNPTPNRTINSNMKPDRTIQKQQQLFWTGQNRLEQRRQLSRAIINFQKPSKSGRPILNWTEPSRFGHNHQAAYRSRKNWNKNSHVRPQGTTTVENKSREPNTVENSEEPY